jgi:hypothetical protein
MHAEQDEKQVVSADSEPDAEPAADAPADIAAPSAPVARDAEYWAKGVTVLRADQQPTDGINLNVTGRRVNSPIQGFGQMWEKTYLVRLSGATATPEEVIAVWKEEFPSFWPSGNRFYRPLTGIRPGEVAVLNLSMAPMVRLSTGVMVLYADPESFTLMTPQGHVFAGWITFSAHKDEDVTVAQTEVLMRANDPFYEAGLILGGHGRENRFWEHTLTSLATRFGVDGQVISEYQLIDKHRQWKNAKNAWHNAMIRSTIYDITRPVRWGARKVRGTS